MQMLVTVLSGHSPLNEPRKHHSDYCTKLGNELKNSIVCCLVPCLNGTYGPSSLGLQDERYSLEKLIPQVDCDDIC